MVIVKIFAGLGNQMFQYAFGRAYELKTGKKVFYDINWLLDKDLQGNNTNRDFELDVFNAKVNSFKRYSVINYILKRKTITQRILYKFFQKIKVLKLLEERVQFNRDEKLEENISNISHIIGYFQTEDYFRSYRKQILKDFSIKKALSKNSLGYKQDILNSNSISMHIRRGDYLSNIQASKHHMVCDISYYQKAVNYILSKVSEPVFFIFSDDLDWVKKQNLTSNNKTIYVEGNNGKNSYEDMILMSHCNHNIIANSSFSWWGAWLNNKANKHVVAPLKWYPTEDRNKLVKNLIPEDWVRI